MIKINTDPKVELKLQCYPKEIKQKLQVLRNLIIETATEDDTIEDIEEALK